jgi:hypothetical protein
LRALNDRVQAGTKEYKSFAQEISKPWRYPKCHAGSTTEDSCKEYADRAQEQEAAAGARTTTHVPEAKSFQKYWQILSTYHEPKQL